MERHCWWSWHESDATAIGRCATVMMNDGEEDPSGTYKSPQEIKQIT